MKHTNIYFRLSRPERERRLIGFADDIDENMLYRRAHGEHPEDQPENENADVDFVEGGVSQNEVARLAGEVENQVAVYQSRLSQLPPQFREQFWQRLNGFLVETVGGSNAQGQRFDENRNQSLEVQGSVNEWARYREFIVGTNGDGGQIHAILEQFTAGLQQAEEQNEEEGEEQERTVQSVGEEIADLEREWSEQREDLMSEQEDLEALDLSEVTPQQVQEAMTRYSEHFEAMQGASTALSEIMTEARDVRLAYDQQMQISDEEGYTAAGVIGGATATGAVVGTFVPIPGVGTASGAIIGFAIGSAAYLTHRAVSHGALVEQSRALAAQTNVALESTTERFSAEKDELHESVENMDSASRVLEGAPEDLRQQEIERHIAQEQEILAQEAQLSEQERQALQTLRDLGASEQQIAERRQQILASRRVVAQRQYEVGEAKEDLAETREEIEERLEEAQNQIDEENPQQAAAVSELEESAEEGFEQIEEREEVVEDAEDVLVDVEDSLRERLSETLPLGQQIFAARTETQSALSQIGSGFEQVSNVLQTEEEQTGAMQQGIGALAAQVSRGIFEQGLGSFTLEHNAGVHLESLRELRVGESDQIQHTFGAIWQRSFDGLSHGFSRIFKDNENIRWMQEQGGALGFIAGLSRGLGAMGEGIGTMLGHPAETVNGLTTLFSEHGFLGGLGEMGKAMIGWEQFEEGNISTGIGEAFFNIFTTVGTLGTGTAVNGGARAAVLAAGMGMRMSRAATWAGHASRIATYTRAIFTRAGSRAFAGQFVRSLPGAMRTAVWGLTGEPVAAIASGAYALGRSGVRGVQNLWTLLRSGRTSLARLQAGRASGVLEGLAGRAATLSDDVARMSVNGQRVGLIDDVAGLSHADLGAAFGLNGDGFNLHAFGELQNLQRRLTQYNSLQSSIGAQALRLHRFEMQTVHPSLGELAAATPENLPAIVERLSERIGTFDAEHRFTVLRAGDEGMVAIDELGQLRLYSPDEIPVFIQHTREAGGQLRILNSESTRLYMAGIEPGNPLIRARQLHRYELQNVHADIGDIAVATPDELPGMVRRLNERIGTFDAEYHFRVLRAGDEGMVAIDELGQLRLYSPDEIPAFIQASREAGNAMRIVESEATRLYMARRVLNLDELTPVQQQAIMRAHRHGALNPDGTYSFSAIREKHRILREAGFTHQQSRALIENWVTGEGATVVDDVAGGGSLVDDLDALGSASATESVPLMIDDGTGVLDSVDNLSQSHLEDVYTRGALPDEDLALLEQHLRQRYRDLPDAQVNTRIDELLDLQESGPLSRVQQMELDELGNRIAPAEVVDGAPTSRLSVDQPEAVQPTTPEYSPFELDFEAGSILDDADATRLAADTTLDIQPLRSTPQQIQTMSLDEIVDIASDARVRMTAEQFTAYRNQLRTRFSQIDNAADFQRVKDSILGGRNFNEVTFTQSQRLAFDELKEAYRTFVASRGPRGRVHFGDRFAQQRVRVGEGGPVEVQYIRHEPTGYLFRDVASFGMGSIGEATGLRFLERLSWGKQYMRARMAGEVVEQVSSANRFFEGMVPSRSISRYTHPQLRPASPVLSADDPFYLLGRTDDGYVCAGRWSHEHNSWVDVQVVRDRMPARQAHVSEMLREPNVDNFTSVRRYHQETGVLRANDYLGRQILRPKEGTIRTFVTAADGQPQAWDILGWTRRPGVSVDDIDHLVLMRMDPETGQAVHRIVNVHDPMYRQVLRQIRSQSRFYRSRQLGQWTNERLLQRYAELTDNATAPAEQLALMRAEMQARGLFFDGARPSFSIENAVHLGDFADPNAAFSYMNITPGQTRVHVMRHGRSVECTVGVAGDQVVFRTAGGNNDIIAMCSLDEVVGTSRNGFGRAQAGPSQLSTGQHFFEINLNGWPDRFPETLPGGTARRIPSGEFDVLTQRMTTSQEVTVNGQRMRYVGEEGGLHRFANIDDPTRFLDLPPNQVAAYHPAPQPVIDRNLALRTVANVEDDITRIAHVEAPSPTPAPDNVPNPAPRNPTAPAPAPANTASLSTDVVDGMAEAAQNTAWGLPRWRMEYQALRARGVSPAWASIRSFPQALRVYRVIDEIPVLGPAFWGLRHRIALPILRRLNPFALGRTPASVATELDVLGIAMREMEQIGDYASSPRYWSLANRQGYLRTRWGSALRSRSLDSSLRITNTLMLQREVLQGLSSARQPISVRVLHNGQWQQIDNARILTVGEDFVRIRYRDGGRVVRRRFSINSSNPELRVLDTPAPNPANPTDVPDSSHYSFNI